MTVLVSLARRTGTASLAGLIAGVFVGGLLGRVVMRVSGFAAGASMVGVHTANGNRVGDITFAGTLGIVLFVGVAAGLVGGIVYVVVEPWLRRTRPWHGVLFGIALLLAFGFTILDPSNVDFRRFGPPTLNVVMFAGLFVIFGVVIAWLFDRLTHLRGQSGVASRVVDGLAWSMLVPAAVTAIVALGAVGGLGDPLTTAAFVAPLAIAVIVRSRGLPEIVGQASLLAGLAYGAVRTVSGLPDLLAGF